MKRICRRDGSCKCEALTCGNDRRIHTRTTHGQGEGKKDRDSVFVCVRKCKLERADREMQPEPRLRTHTAQL